MPEDIVFLSCYSGTDFENWIADFLKQNSFVAKRV